MAEDRRDRTICESSLLESGGTGHKFLVEHDGEQLQAFVIRFGGKIYAYLNECPHLFLELDWDHGEFFDVSEEYIICTNHGALFEPTSGVCVSGPCYGASLPSVPITEVDNAVMLDGVQYRLATQ